MDDKSEDHPDPERPLKGIAQNKYRLITCLSMKWKILTLQIKERIYYSQISRRLLLEEQKCAATRSEAQKDNYI